MNKILVIDDEYAIRLLYEEELSCEGYEVITSAGSDCLYDTIKQQQPDLIILDIRMKADNGLDVLMKIRNEFYNLPVILCSGYPYFKQNRKAIAADYFVDKRSDLRELKSKVKMAMQSNVRLQDAAAF